MHPHVVIVGGGFGGLTAARALCRAPVRITLIDRANHHLFQPLLYQVALAGLSPAEIAIPIRHVLRKQRNASVILSEVSRVDLTSKHIELLEARPIHYDLLILAVGAENTYYGHEDWAPYAPGLKSLDEALEIRRRILLAYEAAERESDEEQRRRFLTFVVIGGGPTGVELAGAIAELGRTILIQDFRAIDPSTTRVVLIEGGPRLLPPFHPRLSQSAMHQLQDLGVEVRTGTAVTAIDQRGVCLGEELIEAGTVLWAAGVKPSPLNRTLGVGLDRAGRVIVEQDCSLPGHTEAFAIGDAAAFIPLGSEHPLPGVSPVAMQQARLVARNIVHSLRGEAREPFCYFDKGLMATIGRSRAVAQSGRLQLSGLLAWLAWLFVHLYYLIGFRNRVFVLLQWGWSYLRHKHSARLITGMAGRPESISTARTGSRATGPRPQGHGGGGSNGSSS